MLKNLLIDISDRVKDLYPIDLVTRLIVPICFYCLPLYLLLSFTDIFVINFHFYKLHTYCKTHSKPRSIQEVCWINDTHY